MFDIQWISLILFSLHPIQHLLLFRYEQSNLFSLFSWCGRQEIGMLTKFLYITQDEEGVLDFSVFDKLLQTLILQDKLVDLFLDFREREPNNKVCFHWKFIVAQRSANKLSTHYFKDLILGSSEEMSFVHLPQLVTKLMSFYFFPARSILQQAFLYRLSIVTSESLKAAEYLRLYKVKYWPELIQIILQRGTWE